MGITNLIEIANDEHKISIRLAKYLTKMIMIQERCRAIDENEAKGISYYVAKKREMSEKEQLKAYY